MRNNEKNRSVKKRTEVNILAVISGLAIIVYVMYTVILLLYKPTDIFMVEYGELSINELVQGYVIRNEDVISGNDNGNGIEQIILEGKKAAKNEPIFRYYSENEQWLIDKIQKLDQEIQAAIPSENSIYTIDSKILDDEIDKNIRLLSTLTKTSEIQEYKKKIEEVISKKARILGENSAAGSELNNLIEERKKYEEELNANGEYINSNSSGLVSYKIDGFETELLASEDYFSSFTVEYFENLEIEAVQSIPVSTKSAKIIDNSIAYIVVISDSDNARNCTVGGNVELDFNTNKNITGEIVYKIKEDKNNIIVIEIDTGIEQLTDYRLYKFEIIWWKDTGLKIPNDAIIEKNGLDYVIRNRSGYFSELLVKIEASDDNYSLVSPYSTEDLQDMGYSAVEIQNMKKISLYDEVLTNPNLHTEN